MQQRSVDVKVADLSQDWLNYAPAMINFALMNADILFDLQSDQAGPRRVN
jgi:hypothetical protein